MLEWKPTLSVPISGIADLVDTEEILTIQWNFIGSQNELKQKLNEP